MPPWAGGARAQRGAANYHAGLAAEDAVAADYQRRGRHLARRRWRGPSGEIDLILREGDRVVFVEVKKARSFDQAAWRLSRAQADRIILAAQEFLAGEPRGQLTDIRFDLALVDGIGRVEIRENAIWAD
jgi:putative endonuclease